MNEIYIKKIAAELNIQPRQVISTARLLAEGATVPFISRYRKEATGSLDEVAVTTIRERLLSLAEVDSRRDSILKSLTERNLLTDALKASIAAADSVTRLEDIYLPYRPKKRTRATIAKEQGLEPLAEILFAQSATVDPVAEAKAYVSTEKGVETVEAALAGARDILAERISDDPTARAKLRALYVSQAIVKSKVSLSKEKDEAASKFKDYFDWSEPLSSIPSHRLLAIRRGETEGFLMMRITVPEEEALPTIEPLFVTGKGATGSPGAPRRARQLQAPSRLRDGSRNAHRIEEESRRRSHPRLRG